MMLLIFDINIDNLEMPLVTKNEETRLTRLNKKS